MMGGVAAPPSALDMLLILVLVALRAFSVLADLPPTCDSEIYCRGELLEDVQNARVYDDSKTFVDMKLRYSPQEVLEKYRELKKQNNEKAPPRDVLKTFVEENFEDGNELDNWRPGDWTEKPRLLARIRDQKLVQFASDLNKIWLQLSRRVDKKVKEEPDRYSLIYVPNGFIIPGGRFKELYYWDTYWIVNGLLACDMVQTAKGVIENLLYLLKTVGHIPNGSRVYYLRRTQPPMITQMVYAYYEQTGDLAFLKQNVQLLDSEMDYWIRTRTVEVDPGTGVKYKLFRYNAPSSGPRPESYREDLHTASRARNEEERQEVFTGLKSGAESGWDFSTRWFIDHGTNKGNLSTVHAQDIVPVDLNAFMHKNFKLLQQIHLLLGNEGTSKKYHRLAKETLTGIQSVLWNDEEGIWLDYDLLDSTPRKYFYMSNFAPLWTGSYTFTPDQMTQLVMKYIKREEITKYVGGTPASLENSGEQWDFPNAWPPLQAIFIQGLDRIGTKEASEVAFHFANLYLSSNWRGYNQSGLMYEKYDAKSRGSTGGGGEYQSQSGFGWTNGLALEILETWPERLRAESDDQEDENSLLTSLTAQYSSSQRRVKKRRSVRQAGLQLAISL